MGCRQGQRKEYKETWWWNEEVKQSIQRKKLPKKKLDRQIKKVDMSTGKFGIPHREMLIRSWDTKEEGKDLYQLGRQRD